MCLNYYLCCLWMPAGAILDRTGSWPLALFAPSVFFFLTGIAVFAGLGTSDAQDFSDNGPFWCAAPADPQSHSSVAPARA